MIFFIENGYNFIIMTKTKRVFITGEVEESGEVGGSAMK